MRTVSIAAADPARGESDHREEQGVGELRRLPVHGFGPDQLLPARRAR